MKRIESVYLFYQIQIAGFGEIVVGGREQAAFYPAEQCRRGVRLVDRDHDQVRALLIFQLLNAKLFQRFGYLRSDMRFAVELVFWISVIFAI